MHVSARGGHARRCAPPALAWAGDEIDPLDASEALSAGTTTPLDVRQPGEFRLDGHIAGSGNVAAFDWEHGFYVPHAGFEDEVADVVGDRDLGSTRVIQRRFNLAVPRARVQNQRPCFETDPRDDHSPKNQPKRVESDRDMSL